jgi:hypothetical protein
MKSCLANFDTIEDAKGVLLVVSSNGGINNGLQGIHILPNNSIASDYEDTQYATISFTRFSFLRQKQERPKKDISIIQRL